MKAGFYQFNPTFGDKKRNFKEVLRAVNNTLPELLVLPEFFATGYQFISREEVVELSEPIPEGPTTEFLTGISTGKKCFITAGLPEKKDGSFYNSAILTGPEGFIGLYRKTHLYSEEKLYFSPGDTGFRVWDTAIGRIGIMICFDWFFPESMRTLALLGAEVVAHPSNLVLPYCPDAMPVRCLENRVYSVTANRTGTEKRGEGAELTYIGMSEIVSPEGKILIRAPRDKKAMMTADIDPELARNKEINPYNDIFKDRMVERYGI
jgi:predicted amidohydrolase